MNLPSDPSGSESPPGAELLFYEALEKGPEVRKAWLAHACGGDDALRREVEGLLEDHERARGFLSEEATAGRPAEGERAELVSEKPGTYIGPYKLLEKIGEGGFGTVWVAEQEQPVRRRVALKVIKLGMDTKEVLARFDQERQALALMDHPNIARMFDAGATPLGRPYFVMELVRGVKITDYCDSACLSTDERLRLFMQVCHAVQHAHQKGIIHRDLKPSNILITLHDGVPVPKVIDFGVAKATREQRLTDLTVYTQFQQMIGTPAYMAPEQAEMSGLDVDTRSDIYSLGVLLYELLTGRTPFEHERLLRAGCDEMRRVLREEDPPKPSTLVSTMALDLRTDIARRRSEESGRLVSLIRGDLDWIAMKALEKDRARRYDSASSLAEDIGRHLTSEPVQARPQSAGYRFRRFARRNRGGLAAAAAVLAALLAGLGAATWMYVREREARERAVAAEQAQTSERRKAEQVARFLRDMLEGVKPGVAIGRDTKLLADVVDRAAAQAATELGSQPAIEAEVSLIFGEVYGSLGNSVKAMQHVSRALELTEKLHGKEHLKYAEVLQVCGNLQVGETAERLCRDALALKIKHLGGNHPDVATSSACLALILSGQGRYPEAESLAREAYEALKQELGPDHRRLTFPLLVLAQAVSGQGRYSEAEQLNRESLVMLRTHYGESHPEVAGRLLNLGQIFMRQGRREEAEKAFRDGLEVGRRVLPVDHPMMKNLRSESIELLKLLGRTDEALATMAAAVKKAEEQSAEQSASMIAERISLLKEMSSRASASTVGKLSKEILEMSLARAKSSLNSLERSSDYLLSHFRMLMDQGRTEEATQIVPALQTIFQEWDAGDIALSAEFCFRLAENFFRFGRHAESAQLYRVLYDSKKKAFPADHEDVRHAMSSLGRTLTEWAWQEHQSVNDDAAILERAREAEELLRKCLASREKGPNPAHWRVAEVQSRLGAAIMVAAVLDRTLEEASRQSRMAEAERGLLDGFKGVEAEPKDRPIRYVHDAAKRLVRFYDHLGKPAEAEIWRKKIEQTTEQ